MKYTLKDSVFTFIFKQPEYARQLYLAATYKEHAEEQKLNLYGTESVAIPRPELYVVRATGRMYRKSCCSQTYIAGQVTRKSV